MLYEAPPNVDFMTWYATLSDDDQCEKLEEMRALLIELGVTIDIKPLVANDLLYCVPGLFSQLSLN
jgi:hypothetical protein